MMVALTPIKPMPRDGEADAKEIRRLRIELAELKRVVAEQSKADNIPGEVWITFDSNGLYEEIEYNRFDVLDAEQRMQRRAERLGLRSVKFVRAE
ncbi:hypothetical protein AB9H29_12230 [Stenotrophomonas sepilia]|uniref:hypothetical protein n=1 Tax=Stenotrophomonas sepilia TaxID=2860290 RepID=UPI003557CCDB